jgi:hypothetical protein
MTQNWVVQSLKNLGLKMPVQRRSNVPWAYQQPLHRPLLLRPYLSFVTSLRKAHHQMNPRRLSTEDTLPLLLVRPPQHRPIPVRQSSTFREALLQKNARSQSLQKAGVTSTPAGNPVLPPRSTVNHHFRPWTDAEDHELVTFKSDARARPAWKTIGLRLKRDPEACKNRWQILKQNMPELLN